MRSSSSCVFCICVFPAHWKCRRASASQELLAWSSGCSAYWWNAVCSWKLHLPAMTTLHLHTLIWIRYAYVSRVMLCELMSFLCSNLTEILVLIYSLGSLWQMCLVLRCSGRPLQAISLWGVTVRSPTEVAWYGVNAQLRFHFSHSIHFITKAIFCNVNTFFLPSRILRTHVGFRHLCWIPRVICRVPENSPECDTTATELSVIERVFKLRKGQPTAIVDDLRKSLIDSFMLLRACGCGSRVFSCTVLKSAAIIVV